MNKKSACISSFIISLFFGLIVANAYVDQFGCGDGFCEPGESCSNCVADCNCVGGTTTTTIISSSFLKNTPVRTPDGDVNIQDLKVEDVVYSYDSGSIVESKVKKLYVYERDRYLVINDRIKVTKEHPFYIDGNWIKAKDIRIGDRLLLFDLSHEVVSSIESVSGDPVTVYNLHVDYPNNYFAESVLVHNKPPTSPTITTTTIGCSYSCGACGVDGSCGYSAKYVKCILDSGGSTCAQSTCSACGDLTKLQQCDGWADAGCGTGPCNLNERHYVRASFDPSTCSGGYDKCTADISCGTAGCICRDWGVTGCSGAGVISAERTCSPTGCASETTQFYSDSCIGWVGGSTTTFLPGVPCPGDSTKLCDPITGVPLSGCTCGPWVSSGPGDCGIGSETQTRSCLESGCPTSRCIPGATGTTLGATLTTSTTISSTTIPSTTIFPTTTLSSPTTIGGAPTTTPTSLPPTEPPVPTTSPPPSTTTTIQCSCLPWINQGCSLGGCASNLMYQTRGCNPVGCSSEGQCVPDLSCGSVPANNAQYVIQAGIPSIMCKGETKTASIQMKNTGNTIWKSLIGHKLASENPADNMNWSLRRVALPSDIQPTQTATFIFQFAAPSTPGFYNFQWRMIQEGVERFGDYTENKIIQVLDCTPLYSLTINPKNGLYKCQEGKVCDYRWFITANDNSLNVAPAKVSYTLDDTSRTGSCDISSGIYDPEMFKTVDALSGKIVASGKASKSSGSTSTSIGTSLTNDMLPDGAMKITSVNLNRQSQSNDAFVIYARNSGTRSCTINLRIVSPDGYVVDPGFTVDPPIPPELTQCPNGDSDCQHYEYCDVLGEKTGFPQTCYDFRLDTGGCIFYDYCQNGKDPSNPAIDCSSNWDSYCYINDPNQVNLIRNVCQDATFVDHNVRSACGG